MRQCRTKIQEGVYKIPYMLPPGIKRDYDNTSPIVRQQNEQSLLLTVTNLKDRDARAVFKNQTTDLINYKRLKMFFHAEENDAELADDELTAFVRLGTDFTENYYEIELMIFAHSSHQNLHTMQDCVIRLYKCQTIV